MRRILLFILLVTLCGSLSAQNDSLRFSALDSSLVAYFRAIEPLSSDAKNGEVDFMIGSCDDAETRNHVAVKAYDHYLHSHVMGDEAVAVHIADEWFIPGKASMYNDIDMMNARIFADFNRRSLVGKHAPSLLLEDRNGRKKEALGVESDSLAAGSSRYRVLFFYDTDCSVCAAETVLLRSMFDTGDYPVDFIAVYVGDNRGRWEDYIDSHLDFKTSSARFFHYWDPDMSSDFQRKYGVLQTPKMFLIGKDAVIEGRNLDVPALVKLLDVKLSGTEYGDAESMSLFSRIFPEDSSFNADSVRTLADYIADRTLVQRRDTAAYKSLIGNMLYYFAGKRGETFADCSEYVADFLVLERPDIWNTADDSLKVVGYAGLISELADKARIGSVIDREVRASGKLLTRHGSGDVTLSLGQLKKGTCVVFYTHGCGGCDIELEAAGKIVSMDRKARILLVDMDSVMAKDSIMAERLFDTFDLSAMPFVMAVGRKHCVSRKYFSLGDIVSEMESRKKSLAQLTGDF